MNTYQVNPIQSNFPLCEKFYCEVKSMSEPNLNLDMDKEKTVKPPPKGLKSKTEEINRKMKDISVEKRLHLCLTGSFVIKLK